MELANFAAGSLWEPANTSSLASFAPESVDVLTHLLFLEHVSRVRAAVAPCGSMLKPGEVMIVEVCSVRRY